MLLHNGAGLLGREHAERGEPIGGREPGELIVVGRDGAAALLEPGVDGALIGGASLKPDEMAGIAARAGITAQARGLAS